MKVIGVDFGTTNVRIATWESDGRVPEPARVGQGGQSVVMPSVVAFERQAGGKVRELVGEEADQLDEGPNRVVIRNLKRWLLASDKFGRLKLETGGNWPQWWDQAGHCVRVWDHSFPADRVVGDVLAEALGRVGLTSSGLEWRSGCPVTSDFSFRKSLVDGFSRSQQCGKVKWITPEPLLVLAALHARLLLAEGSYLVYDIGGGSFDCALAEVRREGPSVKLIVYAADGDPFLGGMDIDKELRQRLRYTGPDYLLRLAKENAASGPQPLPGGLRLTYGDVLAVLREQRLFERTMPVMMDVYKHAKLFWKRPPGAPPIGDDLHAPDASGIVRRTVWQLREEDIATDVDGVVVFGGPTQTPYFADRLRRIFGHHKVYMVGDMLKGIEDPVLTGAAIGACYTVADTYIPFYLDRVPARVVLRLLVDGDSGESRQIAEYEPFERLPWSPPTVPYRSCQLLRPWDAMARYQVEITDPDGEVWRATPVQEARVPNGAYRGPLANTLCIVVDRFGRVWVEMGTGKGVAETHTLEPLLDRPPWQTGAQRQAWESHWQEQQRFEQAERGRLHEYLWSNPYGWQDAVG